MTKKINIRRLIALMMTMSIILVGTVGCGGGGSAASSSSGDNDVLYGNASDSEDGDYIVDENGNTVLSPKPGIGGGTGGGGSQGKPSEDHHIDPDAKKAFLASVPKGLSGQTVKVLVWWAPGVAETAKAAEFEAATGIKIKFVQCNVDGSFQKLAAMIGQGNAPDLACIEQSNFPAIVMQDYFQPLSVGKLDLSDKIYDKETMDKFKWDGQYYGAMIKSSTMVTFYNMFYNADMFSRYGIKTPYDHWQGGTWDWDQLVATSLELKKNGVKAPLISDYHANCFIPSAGTDPVKFEGNKIINNCNDDKLLKAWQFLNDMKTKHKILNTDLNYQFFFSGEAAMLMTGNYIMQRGDEIDKNVKFKWGFAPIPSPKGQDLVIPSTVKLWGFPKEAKNTEAASYWLRYWLDSAFDTEGSELWNSTEAANFNNWLWEQPKQFTNFYGVVSYGGNYKWYDMTQALSTAGADNVKSVLDSWSGVIDANIEQLKKASN